MKKALLLVVLSILLFSSIKPTLASETDVPYSGYAERSEYDRIEKVDGIWYGVITINDFELLKASTVNCMGYFCDSRNEIYLNFSREVEQVSEITYQYQFEDYCEGTEFLGICFGDRVSPDYEVTTVYNRYEDGSLIEILSLEQDNIVKLSEDFTLWTNNQPYDFLIKSDTNEDYDEVKLLTFILILTEAEIAELKLDIQAQYEQEYNNIINDSSLTEIEKQSQVNLLNSEYAEYDINFGDEMEVPCVGDCEIDLPDEEHPVEDWIDKFFSNLDLRFEKLIEYIVIGSIIAVITGLAIYQVAKSIVDSIIKAIAEGILTILRVIGKAIWYWVELLVSGINATLSLIFQAFTK